MHRCIKCKKLYDDDTVPLFDGCGCGSKFFVFAKTGEEAPEIMDIPDHELDSIKEKVDSRKIDLEILSVDTSSSQPPTRVVPPPKPAPGAPKPKPWQKVQFQKPQAGKPKSPKPQFGIETVRNPKPGVYDINIEALLNGKPVIIFSNGKTYIIHLATAFKSTNN